MPKVDPAPATDRERLLEAIRLNREDKAKRLLDQRAARAKTGERDHSSPPLGTYLVEAVRAGHPKMVKLLIAAGAPVNIGAEEPLRTAAMTGNTEILKILLRSGANLHIDQDIALRGAAKNGKTESVRVLLEAGARIDANQNDAFVTACSFGHKETVELLLDKGGELDDLGLCWAAENGHPKVVKLLVERGANVPTFYHQALRYAADKQKGGIGGWSEVVKLLLNAYKTADLEEALVKKPEEVMAPIPREIIEKELKTRGRREAERIRDASTMLEP